MMLSPILCICGCGIKINKSGQRYAAVGHHRRKVPHSLTTRQRMSASHKQRWLSLSPGEQTQEIARRWHKMSASNLAKLIASHRKPCPPETRAKISKTLKGRKQNLTEEQRKIRGESFRKWFKTSGPSKPATQGNGLERKIWEFLTNHNVTFRANALLLDLHPKRYWDLILPEYAIIIEIDGCYFHRCPIHSPSSILNIKRDKERHDLLIKARNSLGYRSLTLWEHEIKDGSGFTKLLALLTSGPVMRHPKET